MLLAGAMGGRPSAVRAQQKAMPVIGYLGNLSLSPPAPNEGAFHQGLIETGYVEGQNVAIEYRGGRAAMIDCPHWNQTIWAL